MEERVNKAKCPFCGKEITTSLNKGRGFCAFCKKEFDVEKAIKLYRSFDDSQKDEDKKVARGEDYLEVERILERAEFYFGKKDYEGAKKELLSALELTNSDYRVYFGMVRVETKDLSDYRNTSHKTWLDRAIDCADADEKSVITRLYKDFYQVSTLSDEEIEQYKKERNAAKKQKLEAKLKESIPSYMKLAGSLVAFLVAGIIVLSVGVVASVAGVVFSSNYVALGGLVFAMSGYVLVRTYVSRNERNKYFNATLDLYDALDGFELGSDKTCELLDVMKKLAQIFASKNSQREAELLLGKAAEILLSSGDEKARNFVIENDVLIKIARLTNDEL